MADRTQFYEVTTGGLTFKGVLSIDGPSIHAYSGRNSLGGSPLGSVAGISELDGKPWLGKDGEHRVDLTSLEACEIEALKHEFGLDRSDGFLTSPAATALASWVAEHPRVALGYSLTTRYMGDWYARAVATNKAGDKSPAP